MYIDTPGCVPSSPGHAESNASKCDHCVCSDVCCKWHATQSAVVPIESLGYPVVLHLLVRYSTMMEVELRNQSRQSQSTARPTNIYYILRMQLFSSLLSCATNVGCCLAPFTLDGIATEQTGAAKDGEPCLVANTGG